MRHMITGLSVVMTIYVVITMVTTVKITTYSRDKNNFKIPYVHLVSFCFNLSWLLGNIMILSYIVILKCHDNRYRREIFSIVISPAQYLSSIL